MSKKYFASAFSKICMPLKSIQTPPIHIFPFHHYCCVGLIGHRAPGGCDGVILQREHSACGTQSGGRSSAHEVRRLTHFSHQYCYSTVFICIIKHVTFLFIHNSIPNSSQFSNLCAYLSCISWVMF